VHTHTHTAKRQGATLLFQDNQIKNFLCDCLAFVGVQGLSRAQKTKSYPKIPPPFCRRQRPVDWVFRGWEANTLVFSRLAVRPVLAFFFVKLYCRSQTHGSDSRLRFNFTRVLQRSFPYTLTHTLFHPLQEGVQIQKLRVGLGNLEC
jgi:hypothetical protein